MCPYCEKRVYPTEKALDSKETVYHKLCLRCEVCKKSLAGKEPVDDDNQKHILPAQYRVKIEDTTTHLFCNNHGEIITSEVKHAETAEEKEKLKIAEMATMTRKTLLEKKKDAAAKMELSMGEVPTDFEEGKRLPVRTFVKKSLERLILTVANTTEKPKPLTFMLVLDEQTKVDGLLAKKFDAVRVLYHPDTEARVAAMRAMTQFNVDSPLFLFEIRDGSKYSATHPDGEEYKPKMNVKKAGLNYIKSRAAFMELTHDGRLKYGAHAGKLGREVVLGENFKFEVTGDFDTVLDIKDESDKVVLSITFDHVDFTNDWKEAMEDVVKPDPDFGQYQKVSGYMFALDRGVLQTIEIILAVDMKEKKLGCVGSNIRCSCWPPVSPEEVLALDPLKNLKENLTMKRRIEEVGVEKATKMKVKEDKVKAREDQKKKKERAKKDKSKAKLQKQAAKAKKKNS